jgi:hypothetical protein
VTLNETIQQIKDLTLSHRQVNHFFFGSGVEWVAEGGKTYPSALLSLIAPVRSVAGGMELEFSFFFSDLVSREAESVNQVESASGNTIEKQSDMLQVALDMETELRASEYEWDVVTDEATVELFADTPVNDDLVAGAELRFTLFVPVEKNRCAIPIDDDADLFIASQIGTPIQTEESENIIPE